MAAQDQYRDQALKQIDDLDRVANLVNVLKPPPLTMPQDTIRSAGLEPGLIHGLCIVGLWAAIDAFLERVGHGGRSLPERLSERVSSELVSASKEIEDIRHLYAHNFGGLVDDRYLTSRRRYVLISRRPLVLSSGATYDGRHLRIDATHFLWYVAQSRAIVEQVRASGE
jgi:hypothetical protein